MTPQDFLTEFGHIASAPNGVQRLREMVLGLAFQGRLIENDHGGIEALLLSLAQEKAEFLRSPTNKKLIREVDLAHWPTGQIPPGWKWVSLSSVGHSWGQKIPDCSFTYIDVSAIENKLGRIKDAPEILDAKDAPSRARKLVKPGTVIYSTVRPYLLNIAVVDRQFEPESIASTAFAIIHPWDGILNKYLYYWLRSPTFIEYVEAFQTGTAYPAVNDEIFFSGPFPLSPLAEQKRIVAKVDELMALCDKLEALQIKRKAARAVLTKEILGRVASDATVDPQTCLQNLSLLASDVDQIPVLRQTILSLAVQGKLVPQDLRDKDAPLLKSQIVSELRSLCVKMGVRPGEIEEVISSEKGFPSGWGLAKLKSIGITQTGTTPSKSNGDFSGNDIPFIKPGDIKDGAIDYSNEGLSLAGFEAGRQIPKDSVLMVSIGGSIGKAALVDRVVSCNQQINSVTPINCVSSKFVLICIRSPEFQREVTSRAAKGTLDIISKSKWESISVPLPPLAEQKRIVAKVDELMALCDTLEAKLRKASQVQEQLAISSIAALTGIQSQEKEAMKAPKTELVSRLKIGKKPSTKDQAPLAALLVRHNGELSPNVLWQHSGMERIDDFYHQLKFEMNKGWIVQPEIPSVRVVGER